MRIAVLSCHAYRDTWKPFFNLFHKFWPDCRFPIYLVTDRAEESEWWKGIPGIPEYGPMTMQTGTSNWCSSFSKFAVQCSDEPILMLQDDFFLTRPIDSSLVERGLALLQGNVGAVRLYPCPGASMDAGGDEAFGVVPRGTRYRVSCQASIWNPEFVRQITAHDRTGFARDFELEGSPWAARNSHFEVMAFRRDVSPWPMEYLCTAIARGKWDPDAKRLCDLHGINVDWSSRGFIAA